MADTGDERRLAPEALQALGLERQPFDGVAPVPPDEDDETRVNLALGVLDARATPLLVSGLPASGRTHFLTQVAASAETLAATWVDARAEDPAAALVAVSSRRGPQALLVDNADALDGASLDALLRHARELDCGLALALEERTAEATARQVSDTLALAEPPPVLRLPPFSEQKTRIHVDHRIAAAGGSPSRLLRPADYRRIHRVSEGLPGRIDTVAAGVLRAKAQRGAGGGLLGGHRRTLLLAGGALAIAALSLTMLGPFGGDDTEDFQGPEGQETVPIDITRQAEEDPAPANDEAAPETADPAGGDGAVATPEPEPGLPDVWGIPDPLAGLPDPEREPAPGEADAGAGPTADAEATTAAGASGAEDGQVEEDAGEGPEAQPGAPETATADTEAATDAAGGTAPPADEGGTAAPATDNEWFASRPAEHYTIQLLAARQMSTVERFLGRHPEIADEVRVVEGERDGDTWFRLFLGDYAERDAARAALTALPEGARSAGAWTPTFGSVRDG